MNTKKTEDSQERSGGMSEEAVNEAAVEGMKHQLMLNLYNLIKQAEEMGIDLNKAFPTPPGATTTEAPSKDAPRRPGAAKSEAINTPWWEWEPGDLDDNDMATFSPLPVPGIVWPKLDEFGRQKIRLEVNNLVCWLTVGEPNTVHSLFYHEYMNKKRGHDELELYKRTGPANPVWGQAGPNGQPAWLFQPFARTFGYDIDGLSLGPSSETIDKYIGEATTEE